jgi:GWxTD domain-containing protein
MFRLNSQEKRQEHFFKTTKITQIFLFINFITLINLFPQENTLNTLPLQYKKWLEEEVTYIITPIEKRVFLQLKTDRDRDLFINAFWKQRDPFPLTERNEFKDEHYKRLNYANRNFGKEVPLLGWKTERGRIYIILGPPNNIQTHEDSSSIYPTIVWFYQGMSKYGLPDAFNIVFFKKYGIGEYKIYSPSLDGPQSLLALGKVLGFEQAYEELLHIAPALARVSISLIPGDSLSGGSSSISSDRLIVNINSVPQEKVKDEYAEKILLYKDIIEVEYSSNYIENDSLVKIIQDKSGIFFVNYLVEIDKLAMDFYEGKYFAKISINGKVSDLEGNTIFQYEKVIPMEFNEEQFSRIKSKKFSFQDMFPLIEGNYKFNLLIKNEVSKEFTSIEKDIAIPPVSSLLISPLILAYDKEEELSLDIKKAFKTENFQLYPTSRNDFIPENNLFLFFQIYGLNEELKKDGALEIVIYKGEEKFRTKYKKLKEYGSFNYFLEEFSLADFPFSYYEIRVSLFDENDKEILYEEDQFSISPIATLERAWINSSILPSSDDQLYLHTLGNQLLKMKKFEKAKTLLEKAYQANPTHIQFALSYSNVLFVLKEYRSVKEILIPFLMRENYEVLELLARACHGLAEYEKAIFYYKDLISHIGLNYPTLTLMGDCYYQLGDKEEALKAWEKSLEINPNQDKIKKIVDSIKQKKNIN